MVNTRAKIKKTQNISKACFSQASMEDFDHQTTQSGSIIGSNDDLLTEILLRLPVTSILRFKSVSKHWHWLLSDKHFTQRYDNLLKSPGIFVRDKYVPFDVENPNPNPHPPPFRSDLFNDLDVENQSTLPFRGLKFYFDRSGVEILQSCNGLLLCCTDRGRVGRNCADKYYVFNPTTKQLELIPPVPRHMKASNFIGFTALAFHQTDRVHYKVVRVCFLKLHWLYQIQIYSFDTRKWKISIESFSAPEYFFFGPGIHCNGAVHWTPMNDKLWYFKVDVEQLETMSLPEGMMSCVMYLAESRGHLHLIAYKKRPENGSPLNVFEMLNDHSGWFVKYQLQLDALPGAFPSIISWVGASFSVIDVVRGEEEEDTFLVLKISEKIITYNVHDKSFKQIFSSTRFFHEGRSGFHRYTETLSSF